MPTILAAAASGLVHNQDILDTVAHNLANLNTSGFKAIRALHQGRPEPPTGPDTGRLGVALTTRDLLLETAALLASESPLHAAIQDDAFFIIRGENGQPLYTRYGGFQLDATGTLVDQAGRIVPGVDGEPLQLPQGWTDATLDATGTLTAIDENGQRQPIGRLQVARFANPAALELLGQGLYQPTANTGELVVGTPGDAGFAPLRPAALESSNVDMAQEFVTMLVAQRAYSACAKTFAVGDAMLELATRITR